MIVQLRSGEALRGTLTDRHRDRLELQAAELIASETGNLAEPVSIDGTVELDRDNVTWVQVTP